MRSLPWLSCALYFSVACGNTAPIGLEPGDAGLPDRGEAQVDAGTPAVDAGAPAIDAGSSADAGTTPIGGQRLKARFVESEDGKVRRLLGLIDTVPDQACWLTRFGDVDQRAYCYPRASGMLVYLDAACTQLAVETSAGDRQWVIAERTVRLGRRITPTPAERHFYLAPGSCTANSAPSAAPIYEVAEMLGAEALAGGTVVRGTSSDRLTVLQFVGDDGSSVPYRLIDVVAATDCTPGETAAGPRCRPDMGTLHDEGRLDERCDRLAILDYGMTPVAPIPERNGDVYRFDFPPRDQSRLQLGRAGPGGMCQLEQAELGRYTLHLGTPYPPQDWAPIPLDRAASGPLSAAVGRLPSGAAAEIEPRLDPSFEFDGQRCGPVWARPGELRCLPTPDATVLGWVTAFADARCSERALAMEPGSTPPVEVLLADNTGPDELPFGEVRPVGEALDMGRVYVNNGRCTPTTQAASYFRLGRPVDPSRFPVLRLVTE